MNRWFGGPWPSAEFRAPVCEDDALRIPVPVGEPCYLCDVPFIDTDRGQETIGIGAKGEMVGPLFHHIECIMRNTQGCSASLRGEPHDHTGPYREDALRVWALLYQRAT